MKTRIITIALLTDYAHDIFDEGVTEISIDNEAEGEFISVKQSYGDKENEVRFYPNEIEPLIKILRRFKRDILKNDEHAATN